MYPLFSIELDNQWYIAIGTNRPFAVGKLFPCTEDYALMSEYFLGVFAACNDELPCELEELKSLSANISKTNERDATEQLYRLLHKHSIPCRINLHSGPDLTLYNGFYLVEIKSRFPKNMYLPFIQVIEYLNEYGNARFALLLELYTGKYYLIEKERKHTLEKFNIGTGIITDCIRSDYVKLIIESSICWRCPLHHFTGQLWCHQQDCPAYKAIEVVEERQDFELKLNWISGKLTVNRKAVPM